MAIYKICGYCGKKYQYGSECPCNGKKKHISEYDRYQRNPEARTLYNCKQWKMTTDTVKGMYCGMCIMCLLGEDRDSEIQSKVQGKIVPYNVVHHIVPIDTPDGWNKRLSINDCVCLCHECHAKVHAAYNKTDRDRTKMQDKLYEMIERYKREYR